MLVAESPGQDSCYHSYGGAERMDETGILHSKEIYLLFSGCFALSNKDGLLVED